MNCSIENAHIFEPRLPKIPRPPNAFMLYANDHRKYMAHLYPTDSNKEISRKLGQTWKDLGLEEKNRYFQKAKDIDLEHKKKYPGYVYNPKDARLRKAIRTSLKDKAIGASPVLPRPYLRRASDLYVALEGTIKESGPMWNGACSSWTNSNIDTALLSYLQCPNNLDTNLSLHTTSHTEYVQESADSEANLDFKTDEEKLLFEKEKTELLAAESYCEMKVLPSSSAAPYLPISATRYVKNPELFTNNVEYHREYIMKYFNHIPDYETFQVTTEDGVSFPYVTIPNLVVGAKYNNDRY